MTDPAEGRNEQGRFTSGNGFWRHGQLGRRRKFETAEELAEACEAYFRWASENPLVDEKPMNVGGEIKTAKTDKMRAWTVYGLCNFIGIHFSAWHRWRDERPDLLDVIEDVDQIMFAQKLEGAASDLFNPMIIGRVLGLAEKQDHTSSDGTMTPKDGGSALDRINSRLDSLLAAQAKGDDPKGAK